MSLELEALGTGIWHRLPDPTSGRRPDNTFALWHYITGDGIHAWGYSYVEGARKPQYYISCSFQEYGNLEADGSEGVGDEDEEDYSDADSAISTPPPDYPTACNGYVPASPPGYVTSDDESTHPPPTYSPAHIPPPIPVRTRDIETAPHKAVEGVLRIFEQMHQHDWCRCTLRDLIKMCFHHSVRLKVEKHVQSARIPEFGANVLHFMEETSRPCGHHNNPWPCIACPWAWRMTKVVRGIAEHARCCDCLSFGTLPRRQRGRVEGDDLYSSD